MIQSTKLRILKKIQTNNQAKIEKIQTNNSPKNEKIQRNNGFGWLFFALRIALIGDLFSGVSPESPVFLESSDFPDSQEKRSTPENTPSPREIIPPTPPKYTPRNIQHARARLLQIAAN